MSEKPQRPRIKNLREFLEVSGAVIGSMTVVAAAIIFIATYSAKTDANTLRLDLHDNKFDRFADAIKSIRNTQTDSDKDTINRLSRLEGKMDVLLERTK